MKVSKVEVKVYHDDRVIEILKEGDRPCKAWFTNPLTVRNLENSQLWIEVLRPIMEALDVDFSEEPNEVVGYKRKPVRLGCLPTDTVFYILPDGENAYRVTHRDKIITMYCEEFNLFYSLPPDANVWVDLPKVEQVTFGSVFDGEKFYADKDGVFVYQKHLDGPTCKDYHTLNANAYAYESYNNRPRWTHFCTSSTVYIDRKDE